MSRGADKLRPDLRRVLRYLDSLPDRSVVLDPTGVAWQEFRGYWYRADGAGEEWVAREMTTLGPFKRMEVAE